MRRTGSSLNLLWVLASLLSAAVVGSCAGQPTEVEDVSSADDDDSAVSESLWSEVYSILDFRCACHTASEGDRGGFGGLETAQSAYASIVGVPSRDIPEMNRVEPFSPEDSYLVHKIEGQASSVGGDGNRMPPTGFALRSEDKDLIRQWIEEGAEQ